jgi:hypothetical protein
MNPSLLILPAAIVLLLVLVLEALFWFDFVVEDKTEPQGRAEKRWLAGQVLPPSQSGSL